MVCFWPYDMVFINRTCLLLFPQVRNEPAKLKFKSTWMRRLMQISPNWNVFLAAGEKLKFVYISFIHFSPCELMQCTHRHTCDNSTGCFIWHLRISIVQGWTPRPLCLWMQVWCMGAMPSLYGRDEAGKREALTQEPPIGPLTESQWGTAGCQPPCIW